MTELREKINNIVEEKNTKVLPENIKAGVQMFNITGTFTNDADATKEDILLGKTAYVNGEKLTGTYEVKGDEIIITPSKEGQVQEGLFSKVTVTGDENLIPENIKQGVSIFNIEGRFEGQSEGNKYNALVVPQKTFTLQSSITEVEKIDLSNVTTMEKAFHEFRKLETLKGLLNTENVTSLNNAFGYCEKLTTIPEFNTSKVTSMSYAFTNCLNLTEIPSLDTSNVINMNSTFRSCPKITTIPNLNTSNVKTMEYMFGYCSSLNAVPLIDTSSVTNMNSMFYSCSSLIAIPKINTSKVTSMAQAFYYCQKLTELPEIDTSNNTSFYSTFNNCRVLITIPKLEAGKVNNVNAAFNRCAKLTNFGGLVDLGKGYTNKSNNYTNYRLLFSNSNNLTHESLINIINNLYDLNLTYDVANGGTLYTQSLVLGATNKVKLTAEEIAIATAKRLVYFVITILPFNSCINIQNII